MAALGTPAASLALLALTALRLVTVEAWSRVGESEAAEAFATSWSAWLLAAAIVADAVAHALRRLPAVAPVWFSGAAPSRAGRRAVIGGFLLSLAWLLAGVGLLTSLAARDRFTLWLGDGERFDGQPGQFLARSSPRRLSPGPKPLDVTVRRVSVRTTASGDLRSLDVRLEGGGATRATSPWRPVWLGGSRFLRATGYGYAPRFEVRDAAGRLVDGAFVKLDIVPIGRTDEIRTAVMPHRFYVRLAPGASAEGRAFALDVEVFRGKLPVAAGRIRLGELLPFEGFTFAVTEVNYLAWLILVDDAGVLVLLLAGSLALAGAALRLARGGSAES